MSARARIHAMLPILDSPAEAEAREAELDCRLDAHRAEVLAADGQAYDGELVMLRGLLATLHAVVEHGDLPEVRQLLAEYRRDDEDARAAEGKCSRTPAAATPGPTGRVAHLLDAIRTRRGRWTTTRAAEFYRDHGIAPPGVQFSRTRTVARGDLRDLVAWGHLLRHEEPGRQYYTLKTRKDVRP